MKKICSFILTALALWFFSMNSVYARDYTKADVEASLTRMKEVWVSPAPAGTSFEFETTDTETIIKSTIAGTTYTSRFAYANGVYSFTSNRESVLNQQELLEVAFENFNISFLVAAIDAMYDEETVNSVQDVQVGDTSHIDTFTLEKDGLSAVILPIDYTKDNVEDNVRAGFIRSISMDINHPNFIKWITDNDGSLIIEVNFNKPDTCDPDEVVDFIVLINNGQPIIKGTPLNKIPIKITEIYCDGTRKDKYSNVADSEKEIGYKVEDLDPNEEGDNKTATVTKTTLNPDGSTPDAKKPNYSVRDDNKIDNSKDVMDFEVIINNGKPVIKGTPLDEVPIKIIEKYRDGTTGIKESTVGNSEKEIGYVVEDFSTDQLGNFIAKVSRVIPNTDGSVPNQRRANYSIVERTIIDNPKTGVLSFGLAALCTIGASAGGVYYLRRRNLFKKL